MIETIKDTLRHQFDAALCMLKCCLEDCPDEMWSTPIATWKFGQVVFHAVFFTDYYLGPSAESQRTQPFHVEHAETFADYEELQDKDPETLHDKAFVAAYLNHCRTKAAEVIDAETEVSLVAPCGFERRDFSRAELYLLTIRHIQHHAAQLSLRLRLDAKVGVKWVGSGWNA